MSSSRITNALLAVLILLLGAHYFRTLPVQAQTTGVYPVYIEPGTRMLRAPDGSTRVFGKVVVDLRGGGIWGFPTLADSPYPIDTTSPQPPVSKPIYLGQFDFAAMKP
jgi:hypothetical protein